jgi:lipoic acid synthetase
MTENPMINEITPDMSADEARAPSRLTPETHQRSLDKVRRIPIRPDTSVPPQPKPAWIRTRLGNETQVRQVKTILRQNQLHSVCEEAACPNLSECFSKGTATFMILGDLCTRRCPFCDVAHGRPQPPDAKEPAHLAQTIRQLKLRYVVITSVNRDDLRDGGAGHFAACIQAIRQAAPATRIEILTPDFRGRLDAALDILATAPPDVFNHNLETVPRLYKAARPGADYRQSLELLQRVKADHSGLPTKSGIMLGLGETPDEVVEVLQDLRHHQVDMLTIGQYLQPSRAHHPVMRYAEPREFDELATMARQMGFAAVASGPMVRSSYHADEQAASLTNR